MHFILKKVYPGPRFSLNLFISPQMNHIVIAARCKVGREGTKNSSLTSLHPGKNLWNQGITYKDVGEKIGYGPQLSLY